MAPRVHLAEGKRFSAQNSSTFSHHHPHPSSSSSSSASFVISPLKNKRRTLSAGFVLFLLQYIADVCPTAALPAKHTHQGHSRHVSSLSSHSSFSAPSSSSAALERHFATIAEENSAHLDPNAI